MDKCPFCHLPSTKSMTDRGTCLTSYDNHFQKWVRGPDCYQRQIAQLQEDIKTLKYGATELIAENERLCEVNAAWREFWEDDIRLTDKYHYRDYSPRVTKLRELGEIPTGD